MPRPNALLGILSLLVIGGALALLWWRDPDLVPPPATAPAIDAGASDVNATPGSAPQAPAALPNVDRAIRTDASPPPRLVGRLVQGGKPLPNVQLRIFQYELYRPTATDHTLLTDAEGNFATAGLPRTFWLAAESPSVPTEWRTSDVAPLTEDLDLGDVEPPPALALDVLVVDAAGQQVPAARCWLSRSEVNVTLDPHDARAPRLVHGDASGRLRLERLHPGSLYLKCNAEGMAMTKRELDLDPERPPAPLQITLSPGGRLEGRVFDWRDQPLANAAVLCEGHRVTTASDGSFVLKPYGGTEGAQIVALGHQPRWVGGIYDSTDKTHIRLERAVALSGKVQGGNAATSIVLRPAPGQSPGMQWPGPYEILSKPWPVAADGTFVVEGLVIADYLVCARAQGLGASASERVNLREDTTIALTIAPSASMTVHVVDANGQPLTEAEIATSLADITQLGPQTQQIAESWFAGAGHAGHVDRPDLDGTVQVAVPPNERISLAVRCLGYLLHLQTFEPGRAPAELTVTLQQAGTLRGVVEGRGVTAYARTIGFWSAASDADVRAGKIEPEQLKVDARGRFHREGLEPGNYFAVLMRGNRGQLHREWRLPPPSTPLVDRDADARSIVPFTVPIGTTTEITVPDPPLGTVRGRVLEGGRAVAGASVFAARPGASLFGGRTGRDEPIDWDDEIDLGFVPGQRSNADGSFVFLYRDAGPLELRVRHAEGSGTTPPVVIDLPPPGRDVHQNLELALGTIRGRMTLQTEGSEDRRPRQAALFALHDAAGDPFDGIENVMMGFGEGVPMAWSRKRCELDADGSFHFANVPKGEWVVRVTDGFQATFAQRLVTVEQGEVDLGELRQRDTKARLRWTWQAEASARQIRHIRLYEPHQGRPAIFAARFAATDAGADCGPMWPGRYLGVVFGQDQDAPLSEPFAIEIHSDGRTTPEQIVLVPAPAPR